MDPAVILQSLPLLHPHTSPSGPMAGVWPSATSNCKTGSWSIRTAISYDLQMQKLLSEIKISFCSSENKLLRNMKKKTPSETLTVRSSETQTTQTKPLTVPAAAIWQTVLHSQWWTTDSGMFFFTKQPDSLTVNTDWLWYTQTQLSLHILYIIYLKCNTFL